MARKDTHRNTEKRAQILAAAERIFFTRGFDRTSVDELRQEAGVSKGTIYAYFEGKEALFRAVCEAIHDGLFQSLVSRHPAGKADAAWLVGFGVTFARLMTTEPAILAGRTVIATADRMPELSRTFFASGFQRGVTILNQALIDRGDIPSHDTPQLARSLLDLFLSGTHRERLLGLMTEQEAHARVPETVERAVAIVFCETQSFCRTATDACHHPTTRTSDHRLSLRCRKQTGEQE
ncbi:TetR family transcriptional regulator [Rhizobium sp. ERR 1071]|uniref:TetR/AcrR family transcriptional regulator n=1 Tax=Rhizobium sp. ERR 1071 TaxID=2572677 RepID=UPI001199476F|nr:TetR/AcrR family transcriptional regulator [Rhizobium sp. ERR1071]TWB09555.1 TetR family transcriptional regulator [Rhizobium sp. ERR1071]